MKNNVRGQNVKVTKSIKGYIENKLEKLDKYFKEPGSIEATVLIRISGHEQIIEVTIPTENFTIRGEEKHDDLYAAIDLVIDKIERQIIKNKSKLNRINKEKVREFNLVYDDEEQDENKIVKRKKIESKPMSEEEAILQMNMLGHDFYIYKDSFDGKVKVLYKRKHGDYGLIEME
jgi:putative sigma-54 modulation protein